MPSKDSRPLCGLTRPDWGWTPGVVGNKDAADPTNPLLIPRTRGVIELAEAGEIVLADAGKKSVLTAPKVDKHKFNVVLTSRDRGWYQWARQFAVNRSRYCIPFPRELNQKTIAAAYDRAAKKAKNSGLIISAGHGFSGGFDDSAVDLAPNAKMRLSSAHFRIRSGSVPGRTLLGKDKAQMETFVSLGKILRKHKIKRVLLISCSVGRGWEFLQDIADEWQVTVIAYTKLINPIHYRAAHKYGIHLQGKEPKTPVDRLHSMREYPKLARGDAWIIKPQKNAPASR